jgi:hypothetical protein
MGGSRNLVEILGFLEKLGITRAQVHHEKLNNKGNEYIFVGYEDNRPQDAYRVFDLKNKTIMITRNVRWLG